MRFGTFLVLAAAFFGAWADGAVEAGGDFLLQNSPTGTNRVVRFLGNGGEEFDIELFGAEAPLTVRNFLNYVESGRYNASMIHRSVPGFVIQGGGFFLNGDTIEPVKTDAAMPNEFGISNLRGTVAMAKLGENPNSATSQWFINLKDNTADLDSENGGYTVFGRVLAQVSHGRPQTRI